MNKTEIINALIEYRDYYQLNNDGRYYGYLRAINSLNELDDNQIRLVATGSIKVYGIGPSITEKLAMLVGNIVPESLNNIRIQTQEMLLTQVTNPHKHPTHRNTVFDYAHGLFPNHKFMMLGSYRRGKQYCGDGDIMMIDEDPSEIRKIIHDNPNIEMVSEGDSKLKFICHDLGDFEYDVRFTTDDTKGAMILMMTGSANFNIQMRAKVKSMGMSLNEYGVTDESGNLHQFKEEIDIFEYLVMDYVNPCDR